MYVMPAAFDDRATAFLPGSDLATELAAWPVACVVGDTAFCHATLTAAQAEAGLEVGDLTAHSVPKFRICNILWHITGTRPLRRRCAGIWSEYHPRAL